MKIVSIDGQALLDRQLVDFPLSLPLLKHMLGGIFDDSSKGTKGSSFSKARQNHLY